MMSDEQRRQALPESLREHVVEAIDASAPRNVAVLRVNLDGPTAPPELKLTCLADSYDPATRTLRFTTNHSQENAEEEEGENPTPKTEPGWSWRPLSRQGYPSVDHPYSLLDDYVLVDRDAWTTWCQSQGQ